MDAHKARPMAAVSTAASLAPGAPPLAEEIVHGEKTLVGKGRVRIT
jgi:hypothetical protein